MNGAPIGRFAPTPSGEMHAGNLLCALLAYLSAKSRGGKFIVRIEDLDTVRAPREAGEKLLRELLALGIESDLPPVWQSERSEAYRAAENKLKARAEIYPCFCSRAQLHAAEAPRLRDGSVVYSGACKNLTEEEAEILSRQKKPCFRIATPDISVSFTDGLVGRAEQDLARECGDFVIRRSDGVYAYQLAVVVDDAYSGVTEVVRGNDLLGSTFRQIYLYRLLGFEPPAYYHIPLVCDNVGRKLSKSDGDDGVDKLLSRYSPERILGALAYAAGLIEADRPASLSELTERFDWDLVPRDRIFLPPSLSTK